MEYLDFSESDLTSLRVIALFILGWGLFFLFLVVATPRLRGRFAHLVRAVLVTLGIFVFLMPVLLLFNKSMGYVAYPSDVVDMIVGESSDGGTIKKEPVDQGKQDHKVAVTKSAVPRGKDELPASTDPAPKDAAYNPKRTLDEVGLTMVQLKGPQSGVNGSVRVLLPRGYSPTDGKTYDVMVFLHGYPGSNEGIASALLMGPVGQKAIDAKKLRSTIVVIPDVRYGGIEPNCANLAGHVKEETWLTRDIPKFVRTAFPNVTANRAGWSISGISSGAWCAGYLTLTHPEVYSLAGVLSGYDQPLVGLLARAPLAEKEANTLSQMMKEYKGPAIGLYLAGTRSDPDSLRLINDAQTVDNPAVQIHGVPRAQGGHNWVTWRNEWPHWVSWVGSVRPVLTGAHHDNGGGNKTEAGTANSGAELHKLPAKKPQKVEGLAWFSLAGSGTTIILVLLGVLSVVITLRYLPRLAPVHGAEKPALKRFLLAGAGRFIGAAALLGFATVMGTFACLALINWDGMFYTSVPELIDGIRLTFEPFFS